MPRPEDSLTTSASARGVAKALSKSSSELARQTDALGLVYWFLRKAGMDDEEARAEFELFMSGTLSEKLLDIAFRAAPSVA
jgi:hypothetical protein